MAEEMDLNVLLGPQFTLEVTKQPSEFEISIEPETPQTLSLDVGVNSAYTPQTQSSVTHLVTAQEFLPAFTLVTLDGYLCTPSYDLLSKLYGITTENTGIGQTTNLIRTGSLVTGQTWTPNKPVYVGQNGVITHTMSTQSNRRIGFAVSTTELLVDISAIQALASTNW